MDHAQWHFVLFGLVKKHILFCTGRETRGLVMCCLDPIAEVIGLRGLSHRRMRLRLSGTYAICERWAERFHKAAGT